MNRRQRRAHVAMWIAVLAVTMAALAAVLARGGQLAVPLIGG